MPPYSILDPPFALLLTSFCACACVLRKKVGLLRVIKDLHIPIMRDKEKGDRIGYQETFKACVRRVLSDADEFQVLVGSCINTRIEIGTRHDNANLLLREYSR